MKCVKLEAQHNALISLLPVFNLDPLVLEKLEICGKSAFRGSGDESHSGERLSPDPEAF